MTNPGAYTSIWAICGLKEEDVRRKGDQKGFIRRKADSWYIEYAEWQKDTDGNLKYKRVSKRVGAATGKDAITKTEAKRQGYDRFVSRANGNSNRPQGMATLRQFIEARFIPDHVNHLKKTSRVFYGSMMANHVIPSLGDFALTDITPQILQMLVSSKLEAGLSTKTIAHLRSILSAIFRHARAHGFYSGELPTESLKTPTIVEAERKALSKMQVQALIEATPEAYKPLLVFLVETGVRIGEALGLRWMNVNLTNEWRRSIPPNSVFICENWALGERTTPKTKSGRRIIPLTSAAWVAMQSIAETTSYNGEDQPVFAGRKGQPLDAHNLSNRTLKIAGKKAGVPWVSFHCLRHTNATFADQALTQAEKQKILGHAGFQMGMSYTHPEAERVREAMEKVNPGIVQ